MMMVLAGKQPETLQRLFATALSRLSLAADLQNEQTDTRAECEH